MWVRGLVAGSGRRGRWVVQVEYYVSGEGTYGETYLADRERMRAY
jgi:hypothetical protein